MPSYAQTLQDVNSVAKNGNNPCSCEDLILRDLARYAC